MNNETNQKYPQSNKQNKHNYNYHLYRPSPPPPPHPPTPPTTSCSVHTYQNNHSLVQTFPELLQGGAVKMAAVAVKVENMHIPFLDIGIQWQLLPLDVKPSDWEQKHHVTQWKNDDYCDDDNDDDDDDDCRPAYPKILLSVLQTAYVHVFRFLTGFFADAPPISQSKTVSKVNFSTIHHAETVCELTYLIIQMHYTWTTLFWLHL